jgi:hypothetical protein
MTFVSVPVINHVPICLLVVLLLPLLLPSVPSLLPLPGLLLLLLRKPNELGLLLQGLPYRMSV